MNTASDRALLAAAYREALYAAGNSDPNPAVGAVIVDATGSIIARGHTYRAGYNHAERNALNQIRGHNLSECSMYVTLEPCCHHGRTPPCTDAILESGIGKVVIAQRDFAAEVKGRSVQLLRERGVSVSVWSAEDFKREQWFTTGPFFFARNNRRPRVLLKWAQTADGSLSPQRAPSGPISGQDAAFVTAVLRFWCKLTIASPGTVLLDQPRLTARPVTAVPNLRNSGISDFAWDFLRIQHEMLSSECTSNKLEEKIRPAVSLALQPESMAKQNGKQNLKHTMRMSFPRLQWKTNFAELWQRVLSQVLAQGFNSALLEAGPAFSEKILQHDFADAIAIYRSREKRDVDLWGVPGRKNSVSALIAEEQKPRLPGFYLLEFAELETDDFLFYIRDEDGMR